MGRIHFIHKLIPPIHPRLCLAYGRNEEEIVPTYNYECESCGKKFEVVQKMVEPPLTYCPDCQSETLKKVIVNGNFVLKGKGWFKDGY